MSYKLKAKEYGQLDMRRVQEDVDVDSCLDLEARRLSALLAQK